MWADLLSAIGCFVLQDGVGWFHHSACMLFFFGVFSAILISSVCFSLRFLSYRDGDPTKPHLNLRGKHFLLLLCVIRSFVRKLRPKS